MFCHLLVFSFFKCKTKIGVLALAGVAQWIELGPANQSCWFDSQSGHMPGLQARSPVGVHERQPSVFLSLPPLCLKINKSNFFLKKKENRCLRAQVANTKAQGPHLALHFVLSVPAPCFYLAAVPNSLPLVKKYSDIYTVLKLHLAL